ncbi:MAG: thioredoxin [Proteobacteria bacterium]|nr:thioredoxin [Pseudomonadota bacterium]
MDLPDDGLVLIVKEDCETCRMIAPLARDLEGRGLLRAVFSQDNPAFPPGLAVADDRDLEVSFRLQTEIVPMLVRREAGHETGRVVGWHRDEWQALTGLNDIGEGLPPERPGCGSLAVSPGMAEELQVRYGKTGLGSRAIAVDFPEDPFEQMLDRGWTDGLPVVPPTPARVLRMLQGTRRRPDDILGMIPPSGEICTVEKAAINAVMAGCRPDYFPVVLAALDAALDPDFAFQGLMSTTMGAGICVIVNGPIARRIGLNSGFNALGHGFRANATIARALQLMVINIGGAVPGGMDRSTLGHPGKFGLCFAEDESDPGWTPLAQTRGIPTGRSAVTVFGFCGTSINNAEKAREPVELSRQLGLCLNAVYHPGLAGGGLGAVLVLGGEYARIYHEAGWPREQVEAAVHKATERPRNRLIAEYMGEDLPGEPGEPIAKFAEGDLLVVRAGSNAGLFSTIIHGWSSGPRGSQPVTREVLS